MTGPNTVINHAEDHDGAQDERTVVHRRRDGRRDGGPETEEDDDEHVGACERVDRDSKHPGDPPRAPCKLRMTVEVGGGGGAKGDGGVGGTG